MNSYIFFFASFVDTVLEKLFDIVGSVFNVLWATLCSIVYGLIVLAFNLFTEVSQLDILSEGKVNGIYQRLTMIITIVMVFYITFEFIKYVISPDTISDKEKGAGKVVARIVTAILLIAFVPTIFDWGYKIQQRILDTNVIPVVVFGQKNWDFKSAGSNFAGNVFSAFYRANCDSKTTEKECTAARAIVDRNIAKFKEDKGMLALTGAVATDIWNSLKSIVTGKKLIQFDGLLALVFGCFTLYVLFSYVLDLGTRYIQLLFLQIIAPVAIISSITPQKDSMLKKWAKQCSTTYLDIFIRLAIIYFMLLIVSVLGSSLDFYEMTKNGEQQINVFVYIVVIAGLLIFVQRAPKLLKELFPQGGAASLGFGFSAKSRLEPLGKTISSMVKPVAAGVGLATGARSIFKRGVGADGKKHLGLNKDLISEKDKKGNKFKDRLKRGATYAVSAAKAGFKGASTGAKTGRFKDAQVSAQQSIQGDETTVVAGGSVLGKTFRSAHYQNKLADQNLSIKEMEENMQKREAQVNVEKSVKTGQDSSEDRAKKKLGTKEQNIKVGKTGMSTLLVGTTDKPGELSNELTKLGINIKEENTTSEIYSMFEAVANSKKASADAINQELTKLEIQLASETDKQVQADLNAKKQQLEVLAQTKSAEAVEASTALTKAEKVLSRLAITTTLEKIFKGEDAVKSFIKSKEGDPVLLSNLQTALTSIENVRNSMTDDEIKALGLTDEVEKSFRSLNITDFDTLDKIQSALTNHASREGDEISKIKENIRKIKESPEYNESTANAAEGKK